MRTDHTEIQRERTRLVVGTDTGLISELWSGGGGWDVGIE